MKKALVVIAISGLFSVGVEPSQAFPIDVVITADNAYGFGFGTVASMTNYFGGIRNVTAGEIFSGPPVLVTSSPMFPYTLPTVGPERYSINVSSADYVYIVTWSDKAVFQGVLAGFQLQNGPLVSGNAWEVFATGLNRDSDVATDTLTITDLPLINAQITLANNNAGGVGTTSIGWVDQLGLLPNNLLGSGALALGGFNVSGGLGLSIPGSPVQGISATAQWMWYNEDPANIANPFQAGPEGADGHREFLIFRTRISDVVNVPEPSTFWLLGAGILGALLCKKPTREKRGQILDYHIGIA